MKTNKIIKILLALLVFCLIFIFLQSEVFAEGASTGSAIDAMSNMKETKLDEADGTGKLGPIINAAIGLIQIAGTGISMVMVSVLGIKYMLAAPNDKADVKKQILPLVIGAIILFSAVNLVSIFATMSEKTWSGTGQSSQTSE